MISETEGLIILLFLLLLIVVTLTSANSPVRGFRGPAGDDGVDGVDGLNGFNGLSGNQGPQGVGTPGTGAQGNQGSQGTGGQGYQGRVGSQGSGAQGNEGAVGIQGGQGSQGQQGVQGSGAQGSQGAVGIQGWQGSQGRQGIQGSGAQGAVGIQGGQGTQGRQGGQGIQGSGAQGAVGIQGGQGAQGQQGSQGSQGGQGSQGAVGIQGGQGAQGRQGSQGIQGSGTQGPVGSQGSQGTQGQQGNQGYQGSGPQGPEGIQGGQGQQGNQGYQGSGPQGGQGPEGIQGGQGPQGNQGYQGSGLQGPVGIQGGQGGQGQQGNQGYQGSGLQGPVGIQGGQGSQGGQGTQGSQGIQGTQGAVGIQGAQGTQGGQGTQGSGAQGSQGPEGIQGTQGGQGSQGIQGAGAQGSQGAFGTQGMQGLQGEGSIFTVTALGATTPAVLTLDTAQSGLSPYIAAAVNGTYFQLWGHVEYAGSTGSTGIGMLPNYPEITTTKTGAELGFPTGSEVAQESTSGIWTTCLQYNPDGATGGLTSAGSGQNFSGTVLLRYNSTTDVVTLVFRNCYQFVGTLNDNSYLEPLTFILSGQFAPLVVAPLAIEQTFASFGVFNPSPATNFIPPDPNGAAGPYSFAAVVNSAIGVYDKVTGAIIFIEGLSPSGGGFFSSVGSTSATLFDPWIVYDHHVGRFVFIAADVTNTGSTVSSNGNIYLAVSMGPNPTTAAEWYKYRFDRTAASLTNSDVTFPDYAKLGYDDKAYYITGNNFGIVTGVFSNVSIFAVNKQQLMTGGTAQILVNMQLTGQFSVHPMTVYDSPSQAMYFASVASGTQIRLYALENILTSPVLTTSLVTVNTFANPADIPQPAPSAVTDLDSVDSRIMSGCVRNFQMWIAHAIADAAAAPGVPSVARWYQFDVFSFPPSAPTLVQQQTIAAQGTDSCWMTHIQVDKQNNMALAFSVCGTTAGRYASIGYTGRRSTDALNTTMTYEIATAGLDWYQRTDSIGRNRWGDYSSVSMDPDGRRFWLFNEYAGQSFAAGDNGQWLTQFSTFSVPTTHTTPLFAAFANLPTQGVIEILRSQNADLIPASTFLTPRSSHVLSLLTSL